MSDSTATVKQTRAVLLRFSTREHQRVAAAAADHGMRITDFCRSAVRVAAGCLPVEPVQRAQSEPSP
jgi:hypothetical protein